MKIETRADAIAALEAIQARVQEWFEALKVPPADHVTCDRLLEGAPTSVGALAVWLDGLDRSRLAAVWVAAISHAVVDRGVPSSDVGGLTRCLLVVKGKLCRAGAMDGEAPAVPSRVLPTAREAHRPRKRADPAALADIARVGAALPRVGDAKPFIEMFPDTARRQVAIRRLRTASEFEVFIGERPAGANRGRPPMWARRVA